MNLLIVYCSSRSKSLGPEYPSSSCSNAKCLCLRFDGRMHFLRSDRAWPALENIRSQMLEVGKMNRVSMYVASQSLVVRTRFKALAENDRGFSGLFDSVHISFRFKSWTINFSSSDISCALSDWIFIIADSNVGCMIIDGSGDNRDRDSGYDSIVPSKSALTWWHVIVSYWSIFVAESKSAGLAHNSSIF